MRRYSSSQLSRIGAISIVVALVLMAAALNLQKFPGMRGTGFSAQFSDASGLHKGNMVQIAGVDVGRVSEVELKGSYVVAHFDIDNGVEFGDESTATIEVLNLLGEKYIDLQPEGDRKAEGGSTIPLARTDSSYDIVKVFGELSDTTERIDIPQLQQALTEVASTMDRTSEEAGAVFDGLSRVSRSIATRDAELKQLLSRARSVTRLLADRRGDLVAVIKDGNLILAELRARRAAIHTLLLNTAQLSRQLGGLVDDNQEQIGPMLADLHEVTQVLVKRKGQLQKAIRNLGPYTRILSNIIGTGPWFDAFASNLGTIATENSPGVDG
jgi:phospholipid/cholesterol/gamma-HCH transport system substrate-binding protein